MQNARSLGSKGRLESPDPKNKDHMHQAVEFLLKAIGENPDREGLLKTPARVVKALFEMTEGYHTSAKEILESATFNKEGYDQMVVLKNINFTSMCEHHMLPFTGTATVGYIPADRVVGLSKLARLVDCFAHRLQIQERLTSEIANALEEHLKPLGVGVIIEAHHSCMSCRGVRKDDSIMVTSALLGAMLQPEPRSEFLRLRQP